MLTSQMKKMTYKVPCRKSIVGYRRPIPLKMSMFMLMNMKERETMWKF